MTDTVQAEAVSGVEMFVPLNKLKKSPNNARKVPHSEATIDALAGSIQHKGMIQNLVIEPEVGENGTPTGFYLVTAGEGRRLAQLLRAKRKQIKKTQPIRCYLDTENDPAEVSLDENVTREAMHPADQFERFRELAESKGYGAQEIGARFGVSATVVKQRLRLGAVSPRLLQVYRENGLTLDQLMAFAISEDHARQKQVFENLHHNREPWIIRRDMTASNVSADDRRAVFVGTKAYEEAGGVILRDLFTPGGVGYFEDAGLLDMLAIERLREIAGEVQAEGWNGPRRISTILTRTGCGASIRSPVALSGEDEARLEELSTEHDALAEGYSSYDEMPEDLVKKLDVVSDEIDAISARRSAYDPNVIATAACSSSSITTALRGSSAGSSGPRTWRWRTRSPSLMPRATMVAKPSGPVTKATTSSPRPSRRPRKPRMRNPASRFPTTSFVTSPPTGRLPCVLRLAKGPTWRWWR